MIDEFQILPEAASRGAYAIDLIAWALLAISTFFSLLIMFAILVFIIRYWHRRQVPRESRISGKRKLALEIVWSTIPLGILLVMFFWGAVVYVEAHQPPVDPIEVNVVGKQWMWKVAHESGRGEINSLHLPAGRPVRLTMISQDVIHSFFIPAFRNKQDVLPRRYTTLWFEATEPGRYHLFCAEYCGTSHAEMVGEVVVQEPEEYTRWAAATEKEPLAQRGRRLVDRLGCLQCHGLVDGFQTGPPLNGLYGKTVPLENGTTATADAPYLRRSIIDPQADRRAGYESVMPSYEDKIEPDQMFEIIAYLRSIKDATGPLAGPDTIPEESPGNSNSESANGEGG